MRSHHPLTMFNTTFETFADGFLTDNNMTIIGDDAYYGYNDSKNSTYNFDWKASLYSAVVPIMILFCLIAVITNLSILFSVRWIRRNLSPTLCFSVSLAVADAYASLIVGIGLLVNSLLPTAFNTSVSSWCIVLVLEGFRLAGLIVSILHLLLLAVNHYIGIIKPLHYASTMTRGKAMLNITVMWVTPTIFFFVYFASVPDQGFQADKCNNLEFIASREFRYITGGLFFVPLILMFFMYVHIFIIVIRHNRGLSQYQGSRNFRHNVKAATTTLLILGTYTIGWMPAVSMYVIACTDCVVPLSSLEPTVLVSVTMIVNTLIILKFTINPIIYAARMKEISGAMKRMSSFCFASYSERNKASAGAGLLDDASNSSFVRSRNDTTNSYAVKSQTTVTGSKKSRTILKKDEPSPIVVYQKCVMNNSFYIMSTLQHKTNKNGVTRSTSNGVKCKLPSPTENDTSFTTSPNAKDNCLLYIDDPN